jgi:class 3 adenylate cyclase
VPVAEVPETRFATTSSGDRVAFQVIGEGPFDVVVTGHPLIPIDLMWDEPRVVYFLNRLSAFCRHIWFDPRGTGASDLIGSMEGRLFETFIEDMVAVIDEVGCERVALLQLAGSAYSALFAATHPERTRALVLVNTAARYRRADDYPFGLSDEGFDEAVARFAATGPTVEAMAPSLVDDARFRRWFDRAVRLTCPRRVHVWRYRIGLDVDLRGVLGSVQAPTLVMHRQDIGVQREQRYIKAAPLSRYLADHIDGAECVELDGEDRLPYVGDADAVLDAIEEFLTGQLATPQVDRVLATVLFTDLVDSTPRAARMGDRRWRELLATHDAVVRAELDRFDGREVKSMGDGVLATFHGPARAIRCACAIRDAVRALGVEMRAGLHTGEIELRGDDITGISVVVGQRVSSRAGPGEVLISRTVADLIAGSDIELRDQGEHELKGVPGTWRLFSVASA